LARRARELEKQVGKLQEQLVRGKPKPLLKNDGADWIGA
jgi:hypothetical protein